VDFVQEAWPLIESAEYIDNWHIHAICEHLEAVTRGEIPKLLINIPPGCSKSLLVAVFWPIWEWINDSTVRWMFSSYDQTLSTRDSVKCRALIESPWYQRQWGDIYQLAGDQNQKTYYETTEGGYRMATTPRGRGTGEHPDRIVVDDPHKVAGAESDLERQQVIDWWTLTMPTRGVSRNARRVIIMQRLHSSDLSGWVLDNDDYTHLCMCMRHEHSRMIDTPIGWNDPREEEGELLTVDQFNDSQVTEMESKLGTYGTAGQLQQRPAPREGGMFKHDWFEDADDDAVVINYVRYWDLAATAGGGDYTCGVKVGRGNDGLYYIDDVIRGQWSSFKRDQKIKETADIDGAGVRIWIEQEPGASGKSLVESLVRMLEGYSVHAETASGSKELRAEPLASQCEAGNVRLTPGSWRQEFLDELCSFPNSAHDDQVDAASGAFNRLVKSAGALIKHEWLTEYAVRGNIIHKAGEPEGIDERSCKRMAVIYTGSAESKRDTKGKAVISRDSVIHVWDFWQKKKYLFLRYAWNGTADWDALRFKCLEVINQVNPREIFIVDTPIGRKLKRHIDNPLAKVVQSPNKNTAELSVELQEKLIAGEILFPETEANRQMEWLAGLKTSLLSWTGTVGERDEHIVAASHIAKRIKQLHNAWGGIVTAKGKRIASTYGKRPATTTRDGSIIGE